MDEKKKKKSKRGGDDDGDDGDPSSSSDEDDDFVDAAGKGGDLNKLLTLISRKSKTKIKEAESITLTQVPEPGKFKAWVVGHPNDGCCGFRAG